MIIRPKISAKDFFLNLGAMITLYVSVISLVDLLFTIINTLYPQINGYSNYFFSQSISWPVATLIIFFPIFILLMWLLEKDYQVDLAKQSSGIHRGVSYITLFLSGLAMSIDLIVVIYYFIDGQELDAGFLLKVSVLLVVAFLIFFYYISDVRGKLTSKSRMMWRMIAGAVVLISIILGFSVLGSPRTQRLYKYDDQKVNNLMDINNQITNFYATKGTLPASLEDSVSVNTYFVPPTDEQTKKPYEYKKLSDTKYELCAEFNKASSENAKLAEKTPYNRYGTTWVHPAGKYCFTQTIDSTMYSKPIR